MEHVKSQSNFCEANPRRRAFAEKVLVDPDRYKGVYKFHHAPPRPAALEEPGNLELDMDHLPDDQVASSNLITNAASYRDNPRPFHDDNAKDGCESADSNARNQLPALHTLNSATNYRVNSCP